MGKAIGRGTIFIYGAVCYLMFLGTFLYAIGFVGGVIVPKTIDSGTAGPITQSILINALLLGLFAIQHLVMARPGFKVWWTKIIPPAVERSTFVLMTNIILITMFWAWQPVTDVVWTIENPAIRMAIHATAAMGWIIVLLATFMIDHFDLFGMRQVTLHLLGRPYNGARFHTPWFYQYVRHPLMLGFIIAFWAAPTMTMGHLMFAAMTTAFILVALQFEERDLMALHGEAYKAYQRTTPMLIPFTKRPDAPIVGQRVGEIPNMIRAATAK